MRRCLYGPSAQQITDRSAAILDVAGAAVLAMDLEGRVVLWNQAVVALTGWPASQIRGQILHQALVSACHVDGWQREWKLSCAGSIPRHFETSWKLFSGAAVSLICSFSLVRDSSGAAELVVCSVFDAPAPARPATLYSDYQTDRTAEFRDISRFLHDTISQDLVALAFSIGKVETTALDLLTQIHARTNMELLERCCRDIRVITYMLAPPLLCDATVEISIEKYARWVRAETGIRIVIDLDPVSETISNEGQLLLLAAAQEWIARGIRGSRSATTSIRLRNSGGVTVLELGMLSVASHLRNPDGWSVIRSRAQALGGEFEIAVDSTGLLARLSLPGILEPV